MSRSGKTRGQLMREAQQRQRLDEVLKAGNAAIVSGGGIYQPGKAGVANIDEIIEAVPPGEHFWVMITTHRIADIHSMFDENVPKHFDMENMIGSEIGCLVCEQSCSKEVIAERCPGEPS